MTACLVPGLSLHLTSPQYVALCVRRSVCILPPCACPLRVSKCILFTCICCSVNMSLPCACFLRMHVAPCVYLFGIHEIFSCSQVYFSYMCMLLRGYVFSECISSPVCMSPPCACLFMCMSPSYVICISPSCVYPSMCISFHAYVAPYVCCSIYVLFRVYVIPCVYPLHVYVPSVGMSFNIYFQSGVLLPCVQSVLCMSSPFIHFAIGILQTFFSNFKQACRIGSATNLKYLRNLVRPPAGCQCSKKRCQCSKKGCLASRSPNLPKSPKFLLYLNKLITVPPTLNMINNTAQI